jgi:hypothetical protein
MLTNHQLRRVALEALTSERTARKTYANPRAVRECTRLRLALAASRLGLPPPDPQLRESAADAPELQRFNPASRSEPPSAPTVDGEQNA